jgi:hypothetical protein
LNRSLEIKEQYKYDLIHAPILQIILQIIVI